MMGEYSGIGWLGPGFGGIFMILWLGLIIAGIVALVRWLMSSSRNTPPERRARDILDERYARGEIDRGEYEQCKHDLED
ncbi:SHOCT domain-containing protein [Magnetovibrio sp. PR-2]|uniref:SHOCT domain-containing protein n=1 Tax=Magnetovibrio sp. PR-2 TaxID=3120356 RepID=UPI002FCE4575